MRAFFPSIGHADTHGYLYDGEAYNSNARIQMRFKMYYLCGDPQFAHTWCIREDYAGDYLYSLAAAAIKDDELAHAIRYLFDGKPTDEQIKFAASLKYDEHKDWKLQRYFSLELRKIGTKPVLQYDKRYTTLDRWHDGSPEMVLKLLTPEYASGIQRFIIADAVRNYWNKAHGWGEAQQPATMLGWVPGEKYGDCQISRFIRGGIQACQQAIQAFVCRESVKGELDCFRHNYAMGQQREERERSSQLALAAETSTERAAIQ